jgi:hypothetical protein
MTNLFSYLFEVNPGGATYAKPSMLILLGISGACILASIILRFWRRRLENPGTKRLSRSWAGTAFWFGVAGLLLVLARVEEIQFLAMRFLWIVWALAAVLYVFFQVRQFRVRHFQILPSAVRDDPREKYLPQRKKR